ncbi:hypothetical protein [Halostella salina]|uniref:hypothetical protein n=1 Tax=Halostella salina TaxID=1547897 RepID=UPI001969DCAB|nr:hypothetical protein [Halostella salina]
MEKEIGFDASRRRIYERCRKLSAAGLIAPMHSGSNQFEITAKGEEYLAGELDAEDLPRPSPRVV